MFDIIKAQSYLSFCFRKDFIDKDFFNKCKKLKYDISDFTCIKDKLNSISKTRKNQKESLKE